jgi:hypothetical protein
MNTDILLDGLFEWILTNFFAGVPVSALVVLLVQFIKVQNFAKGWSSADISRTVMLIIFALAIPFWYAGYWGEFTDFITQLLSVLMAFAGVAFWTPAQYKAMVWVNSPLVGSRDKNLPPDTY